ncbi:MAG TPA: SAM-dependent methyltransferase [Burkholderiales bacterium]|nr:SAM-dependent methyltransferase [Burkholderiales bacterium]
MIAAVVDEHLQRWNERYGGDEYLFGTAPNAFLASHASLLKPGQRALCIADGEGRNSVWLAEQGLVVAIFVQFADPPMRRFMFERMIGALVPGGLVLVEGYTPAQLEYATGGPKQVDQLYTGDLLREAFAALEILELRAYEAVLNEGTRHAGMSALIDLVARKNIRA